MGERKVLNKYYPPDFDPSLIPRRRLGKNRVFQVRMMLPMSVCCNTCGEYMYRGKKFNSKKEDVEGDDGLYLGIRKYRFIMKCSKCNAEFSIVTDPKNGDYSCETGVSRNYELWKEEATHDEEVKKQQDEEEEGDAMRRLENRTEDSKREMDQLDALDEIKALNKRHEKLDTISTLNSLYGNKDEIKITDVDEDKVKALFKKQEPVIEDTFIKRLINDEDEDIKSSSMWNSNMDSLIPTTDKTILGVKLKKKRKIESNDMEPIIKKKVKESNEDSYGGLGLLGDYGSDTST